MASLASPMCEYPTIYTYAELVAKPIIVLSIISSWRASPNPGLSTKQTFQEGSGVEMIGTFACTVYSMVAYIIEEVTINKALFMQSATFQYSSHSIACYLGWIHNYVIRHKTYALYTSNTWKVNIRMHGHTFWLRVSSRTFLLMPLSSWLILAAPR